MNLIEKKKIAIPNPIICYNKLLNRNFDTLNPNAIVAERSVYKQNLSSNVQPVIYNVTAKKN